MARSMTGLTPMGPDVGLAVVDRRLRRQALQLRLQLQLRPQFQLQHQLLLLLR